jgi:hypothetical protein
MAFSIGQHFILSNQNIAQPGETSVDSQRKPAQILQIGRLEDE